MKERNKNMVKQKSQSASLSSALMLRDEDTNKKSASGFIPVPSSVSKARRYYNPATHQEISVRTYQGLQKGRDIVNPRSISDETIGTYNAAQSRNRGVRKLQRFYATVNAGNEGKSVTQSLQAGKLSKQQFEAIREQRDNTAGYTYDSGGKVVGIASSYAAEFVVPAFDTQGTAILTFHQFDRVEAHRMGQYHHAIEEAMKGNLEELHRFGNPVVVDLQGNVIILPTNFDQISLFFNSLSPEDREKYESNIYSLVKGTSIKAVA